jgi:hypothetical protein
LALQEAYRLISVREGDQVFAIPTTQALMGKLARLAPPSQGERFGTIALVLTFRNPDS